MSGNIRKLFIAEPHGFCNGVRNALECVENLLRDLPENGRIYVYNEIVHNSFIVNKLKSRNVQFVHSLDDVPAGSAVVWSAHGVAPALEAAARAKGLMIEDATCPRVQKLHLLAMQHCQNNDAVIFAGHRNHPETVGVMGCGNIYCVSSVEDCDLLPDFPPEQRVVMLTQTTWCRSEVEKLAEVLKKRFPQLEQIADICYATSERQQAVLDLIRLKNIDQLLVIGSPHSSNSQRLCETARRYDVPALLIDDPESIRQMNFDQTEALGITAGASAPELLLEKALEILTTQHNFIISGE